MARGWATLPEDPLFAASNAATLLGRPLRGIATGAATRLLEGARVLVTGAGGSVGSALVARLAQQPVASIIALDQHEASLFRLDRELPGAPVDLVLADVRNAGKMKRILAETRPRVVFHLAGYKHVPLSEYGPDEVVNANVLGTENVACAAIEAGVEQFVYPSTDKAVNPPGAYGATKRLVETLLLAMATSVPTMAIHVVRYVNILGTSGTASELFAQQARQGTPMTLTDERMERYWMAMDEAIDLLFHALGLPSGSRTLLDVGQLVPAKVVAERIARVVRGPDAQPEFATIGARPGERLFEELVSEGEHLEVCGEGPVFRILRDDSAKQATMIREGMEELRALLASGHAGALHQRLMELADWLQ